MERSNNPDVLTDIELFSQFDEISGEIYPDRIKSLNNEIVERAKSSKIIEEKHYFGSVQKTVSFH